MLINNKKLEFKNKKNNIAIAIVLILVLVGAMAYFADASTAIRNLLGSDNSTHLEVEITETGVPNDNGDKECNEYKVIPGSTDIRDPKVTVDTNGDAYVYAIVKDTVNSHGETLVNYQIADGWIRLNKNALNKRTITKSKEIFTDKDGESMVIDPRDSRTKVYYRIVNGTDDASRFEFDVLEGSTISYPSNLSGDYLALLKEIAESGDRALDFQTYAVQMTPFCPADKVEDADPTSDEQKAFATLAWNQEILDPDAIDKKNIQVKPYSITIYPTVPGDQYIVVPQGTTPTESDWQSIGQISNDGEALTFDGLNVDVEYDIISRTPAKSEQEIASKPSVPTTVRTGPLVESITVTEKNKLTAIDRGAKAQMVATVLSEEADQEVTWSSSDTSIAKVDAVTGVVTGVAGGTATITATPKDGSPVRGTYKLKVNMGKLLYQVKLHDITKGTATFWPALNTKAANYGKHDHTGDCIVDHTWAEIASKKDSKTGASLDFSKCKCTKDVPIDTTQNTTVFNTFRKDVRESGFGTVGVSPVKNGSYCRYDHQALTKAVTQCADIKGVSFSFFTPTYNQITTLSQSERKLFISTGAAKDYWLSEADFGSDVYIAIGINADGAIAYAQKTDPLCIVLGLKVTAN